MSEQDRLQLAGQMFASVADTESARFARELARVLAQVERDLLALAGSQSRATVAKLGRLLGLRRDLRKAIDTSGYPQLVTRVSIDAVERMAQAVSQSRLITQGAALGRLSQARLGAMAGLLRLDLLGLGEALSHQVWRAAVLGSFSAAAQDSLVKAIAAAIERTRAQAQTIFDTHVSILGRQIAAQEVTEPEQAYLYVGPVDGRVRDWCLERVGKVYTRDVIDQMDNGQLPNVFLTGGGFSCRHTMMAVSDPALTALANTDQRAEGFAERVATARAFHVKRTTRRRAA